MSEVVIILELAWKPLWVVIISVNSVAKSTLDISKVPLVILPLSAVISRPMPSNSPEFSVVR